MSFMLYALAAIVLLGPVVWGLKKYAYHKSVQRNVEYEIEAKSSRKTIEALRRSVNRARKPFRRLLRNKKVPDV